MNPPKKARIHLDGTVTLYDHTLKTWRRIPACLIPGAILAGMSEKERSFIELLVNRPAGQTEQAVEH